MFLGYPTGFIIGPQFFLAKEAPKYETGFKTMIISFSMGCAAPLGLWVYLGRLNRRKEKFLRESGGEDVYVMNEEFMDLTDREQIHFVYSK
jgi:hypothetical protein